MFLATLLLPVSILMMLLTTVRYLIERGNPTSQRAILKYDVEQLLAGKLPDKFAETQRTIKFYVDADVPDEPAPSLTDGNPLPPDGTLFSLWKHYGPNDTMFNRDSCLGLLFEWVFLLYGSAAPTRDAIRACVDDIEESTAKSRAAILDVDGVRGVTLRDEPVSDVVAKLSHELGPY